MNYFQQIVDNPAVTVMTVILMLYAIREGHNFYLWVKGRLDNYHDSENNKEDVAKQICNIECVSKEHTETLEKLTDSINELRHDMKEMKAEMNKRFNEAEKERRADTVAMARAELYDLYESLKDKDHLTFGESEMFNELAECYTRMGGNGTFKKLIEYIQSKRIQED